MKFNDNLVRLRNEKNISQEDMAKVLSCSLESFNELETGKREPGIQELLACAKALGVTTDLLLGIEDVKNETKQPFNPLSALAGMALPGGFSLSPGNEDDYDIDEELALELAEMASAIDTRRRRKDDISE